jgi:hypothetical protein
MFSIFLSAMLEEATQGKDEGVYIIIHSRQDADLFNVAYFKAKTKSIIIL